jgi:hypothetical protein
MILVFGFWVAFGIIYQKYLFIQPYSEFKLKETSNKRNLLFKECCRLIQ